MMAKVNKSKRRKVIFLNFTTFVLMLEKKNLELFRARLDTPCKIVITTHHKPDGDAMGSTLGLYHFLKSFGHEVVVITPTDYPSFLHWLPGNDLVVDFEKLPTVSIKHVNEADFIFCLDFNALSRINELGEHVAQAKGLKVKIDHHLLPDGFEDINFSNIKASSTCELIYDFILEMGSSDHITEAVANCLYVGIMTDTGSFKFESTSPHTHEVVANLLRKGAKSYEIYDQLFNQHQFRRLQFVGFCLSNRFHYLPEYNTAYIAITAQDLKDFGISTGDTEGLESYPLTVKGIRLGALIIDRTKLVKLSLRSKGDIAVNEICRDYFNGGGHKNASGGSSTKTLDETVQDFLAILPKIKHLLNS